MSEPQEIIETRGSDRVDLVTKDANGDGRTDVWVSDTDGDGTPDLVVDGDGGLPPAP